MIVFDIQAVQSIEHGERGIARYTGELARAMERNHSDLVDVFAYNDAMPFVPRLEQLGINAKLRSFSELRGDCVDVVHINSPFEQASVRVLNTPVAAARTVVTCYDLIPYRFPDKYLPDQSSKAWYQSRLGLLVAADAIVTDSQSAADDVVSMLGVDPRTVTSIGAGTAEQFVPPTDALAVRMAKLRRAFSALLPGFILFPAGAEWRKNLDSAVEAYSRLDPELRERHQLVVASKMAEGQREKFLEGCLKRGVADNVVLTGYVTDADLVRLYQSSELVMFPSLYEGFGLPVLEARRCGARVITSNVSSLPEVMPEPAALFNPYDVDDMAERLKAALTNPDVIARLDAATDPGFTWDLASDRLAEVYRAVRQRPRITHAGVRRRVAVAAPLGSETAQRTLALVDNLNQHLDVTVFVQTDASKLAAEQKIAVQNLRVLPAHHAAQEYDLVVYTLGDEAIDHAIAAILPVVPGCVMLWPGQHASDLSEVAAALVEEFGSPKEPQALDLAAMAAAIDQRAGSDG
ncbi:MAG: glycosyltransferase family 1 protein [Ilumatobacter sp.]|nr:glycosyltransferase family 1 protein [Ilumatobacter sp.]